jgi:hypothetical protein
VCFCRLKGKEKFARLNFVEYYPVSPPEIDFHRTVHEVGSLATGLKPEVVMPCDDAALLVLSRLNGSRNCFIPDGEACKFAMDKWLQIDAARRSGFAVMPTQIARSAADVARFPIRPAVLKPRNALDLRGSGIDKGRSFIIEDDRLSHEAKTALCRRPYLIQEYKGGAGEGFFGIAQAGKIHAAFGHRRLRMMNPAGSGASACVSRQPDGEELQAAETLVRLIAWRGPFMIELLRDFSGKAWFMEFNGRFWGSLALARRCGLDMPRLASDLARGLGPGIPPKIRPGFARHLGRDLIHLLFVLRGPRSDAQTHGWPERISTLRGFASPHSLRSFYNYDPSQPFFFVKDAAVIFSNKVIGRKN